MVDFSYKYGVAGASTWYFFNLLSHKRPSRAFFMYPILFIGYGTLLANLKPENLLSVSNTIGYPDSTPYIQPSILYKYLKSKGASSGMKSEEEQE